MAWSTRAASNSSLVDGLVANGIIKSGSLVESIMRKVDRGFFVAGKEQYNDCPVSIGYGVTISAPHMHAYCLDYLFRDGKKRDFGSKALDVGSGSGYLVACMAEYCDEVWGIEIIPELVEKSKENLNAYDGELLQSGRVHVVRGNGWEDECVANGPFDVIHVGAAADEVPDSLLRALKVGGRMVIPVGKESQELVLVTKKEDGAFTKEPLMLVRYVPLVRQLQ